jgi:alpha-tubulin suppressor-like RCC1 family protein
LGDEENDGFVQSVTLKLPFDSTLGVQSMAAGSHHLMVATQCGKLLAYGANGDGQLGLGPQERNAMVLKQVCLSSLVCLRPKKGEYSTPGQTEGEPWMAGYVRRVISHACGESHTIVLTEEADRDDPNIIQRIVWTFGQGNFGALGTGCRLDAFYPQAVWCRHWGLPISLPDVVYYRPLSEVIMTPKWWDIGGHIGKLLLKTSGRDKKRSMKVGPTRVGAGPRQSVVYCDKQGDVYVFGDDCYHAFGFGAVRFSIYDRPKLCGSISTPWTHVESLTFTECGSFALVAPKPLLQ